VVGVLVDTIKASLKEKVIRVSIATLKNMVEKAPEANAQPMSDFKVLALCQTLSARKWTDEDLISDLAFLVDALSKDFHELGFAPPLSSSSNNDNRLAYSPHPQIFQIL